MTEWRKSATRQAGYLPVAISRRFGWTSSLTTATEGRQARTWVDDIVGTCCAVVALMRHFDLDTVELLDGGSDVAVGQDHAP